MDGCDVVMDVCESVCVRVRDSWPCTDGRRPKQFGRESLTCSTPPVTGHVTGHGYACDVINMFAHLGPVDRHSLMVQLLLVTLRSRSIKELTFQHQDSFS